MKLLLIVVLCCSGCATEPLQVIPQDQATYSCSVDDYGHYECEQKWHFKKAEK